MHPDRTPHIRTRARPLVAAVAVLVLLALAQSGGSARAAGCTLSNLPGPGQSCEQADLHGANLFDANLSGANLRFAKLNGATLSNATLTGAHFSGATCPDGTKSAGDLNGCAGHTGGQSGTVGTPTVADTSVVATAGQALDYSVGWQVTDPLVWRDLDSATVTLTEVSDADDASGPASTPFVITLQVQPGDASTLTAAPSSFVSLNTDASSIAGSGPTGQSVTLTLDLTFAPEAAGKTYSLSIGVRTTTGTEEQFNNLGLIGVQPEAQAPTAVRSSDPGVV